MRKIILLVLIIALFCGCAKARTKDWCEHNEVMVITAHEDNYIVDCKPMNEELDKVSK